MSVTFSFTSGNYDAIGGPYLSIEPYTARLHTAFPFDYETRALYPLTLLIRDESPALGGPPLILVYINLTLVRRLCALSHTHTHTHTLTRTHSHTHVHTRTHTHAYTLSMLAAFNQSSASIGVRSTGSLLVCCYGCVGLDQIVLDANDPPVLTSLMYFSYLSNTVFNNSPIGLIVYNVTSFDQDVNDTGTLRGRHAACGRVGVVGYVVCAVFRHAMLLLICGWHVAAVLALSD